MKLLLRSLRVLAVILLTGTGGVAVAATNAPPALTNSPAPPAPGTTRTPARVIRTAEESDTTNAPAPAPAPAPVPVPASAPNSNVVTAVAPTGTNANTLAPADDVVGAVVPAATSDEDDPTSVPAVTNVVLVPSLPVNSATNTLPADAIFNTDTGQTPSDVTAVTAVDDNATAGAPPPSPVVAGVTPTPGTGDNVVTNAAGLNMNDVFPPGLIVLDEADLYQVLDLYADLIGRTVLRPATLQQVKISISTKTELTRQEAIYALDSVLSLNGIAMVPQGEKFIKAVPKDQVVATGQRFNTQTYGGLPESGTPIVQIVRLKNTVPRDMATVLGQFSSNPSGILGLDDSGILILRDNAENVKRMMEVLEQVDQVPLREIEPLVIPIKYALAADIAQVFSSLSEGGSTTTVGASQAGGGLNSGGGFGGGGFGGGGFGGNSSMGRGGYGGSSYGGGYNNYGSSNTRGFGTLAAATAPAAPSTAAGRGNFSSRLRGLVDQATSGGGDEITVLGQTKIIADERTNSLLIFASKSDIPTIKDIVDKLDVVLPQVLIEGIIMEVALNDSLDYGVSWLDRNSQLGKFRGTAGNANSAGFLDGVTPGSVNSGNVGTVQDALSGGFQYWGIYGDKFDIALRAAASDSRVNVLSRPRIQTSHAVVANLFVGETRPYPTGSYYGGIGGNYSSIQQLQIGITLSVLPLINSDGLVVMDIRQRIQNTGDDVVIDNVGPVPTTVDREASAKVAVRDRETIMLGGFIRSDDSKSKGGVPFLKDIPLIGLLFRSSSSDRRKNELVILIRPTVLPTPSDAVLAAREDKIQMPGIMRAEREYESDRLRQVDSERKKLLQREGFSVD